MSLREVCIGVSHGQDLYELPQAAVTVHPLQSLAHGPDGRRQPLQGLVQGLLVKLPDGTNGLRDRLRGAEEEHKAMEGLGCARGTRWQPRGLDSGARQLQGTAGARALP